MYAAHMRHTRKSKRAWGAGPTLVIGLLTMLAWAVTPARAAEPADRESVQLYTASSLAAPVEAIIARYQEDEDIKVVPVFGASGTLARQIANGAPADIYISAHPQWLDWLADRGVALHERAPLLSNRLVLVGAANDGHYNPGDDVEAILDSVADSREHLVIGNPAHVPAGMYARQALRTMGYWPSIGSRSVRTPSARAALALIERSAADLGIVYRTDARLSDGVRQLGLVPADAHDPIRYEAAVVGNPSQATRSLRRWLASPEVGAIFAEHGFNHTP